MQKKETISKPKQQILSEITARALKAIDMISADRSNGKITVSAIAERIGMTPSNITRLRNSDSNSITLDGCFRLCEAFDISAAWLLMNEGEMTKKESQGLEQRVA